MKICQSGTTTTTKKKESKCIIACMITREMTDQNCAKNGMFHSAPTLRQGVMKNARSTSRSKCTNWMRVDRYCVRRTLIVHQQQHQNGMDGLQSLDSLC